MTTQSDVAAAFFAFEDAPWSASNFRMVKGRSKAWLCGGMDGEEVIFAEREPLRQATVYTSRRSLSRYCRMYHSDLRRQQDRAVHAARHADANNEVDVTFKSEAVPKVSTDAPDRLAEIIDA
jgi:hypothetical protein